MTEGSDADEAFDEESWTRALDEKRRQIERDFRDRLSGYRLNDGGSALDVVDRYGLDLGQLYRFYTDFAPSDDSPWKAFLDQYKVTKEKLHDTAVLLRNAAAGIRYVAALQLPYQQAPPDVASPDGWPDWEESVKPGAMVPDLFLRGGATMLDVVDEDDGKICGSADAGWAFPGMAQIARDHDGAEWSSPFKIPVQLLNALDSRPSDRRIPEGEFPYPLLTATPNALRRIADLLKSLARQMDHVAASFSRGRGNPRGAAKQAFHDDFEAWAIRHTGEPLHDLAAALYSITFDLAEFQDKDEYRRVGAKSKGKTRRTNMR